MPDKPLLLIVQQVTSCPLMRPGDRWMVVGNEILKPGGGRLCGGGLCSVFPKVQNILHSVGENGKLPDDYLLCDQFGCDCAFRMEFSESPLPSGTSTISPLFTAGGQRVVSVTRRMERGETVVKKTGPFLSRLPKELAAELITSCRAVHYEDQQVILMQGIVGESLFIVADGKVEVVRFSNEREETVLVTLQAGDCFGEMSILTGELTSAEVRSKSSSTVLSLRRHKLEALLLKRPALSREFSKLLADRLKATNVSLESELSRGILGKLSMISLVDLVQTLHQSRRTGTLVLNYSGEKATIGFLNGTLLTAIAGETAGDEAFYRMVCWPDGDFCFEQTEPKPSDPGRVTSDMMGLMMEGMRRMDEMKARGIGVR
jgi:CRP-like cAMP-binding protein